MVRNMLMWGDTNTNGLAHAVGQAAQATQGLSQANADIAKIGENITNFGNNISKKFSERREKQLTQYANNLFNEALQGSLTSDGRVDMQKLTTNIKSIRERDKANGDFWKDEEVGNILGQNIIKNLDSIARNQENYRSNKANEATNDKNTNINNFNVTREAIYNLDKQYHQIAENYSVALKNARERGVSEEVIKRITDEVDNLLKSYKLGDNFSAMDSSSVSEILRITESNRTTLKNIINYINQLDASEGGKK